MSLRVVDRFELFYQRYNDQDLFIPREIKLRNVIMELSSPDGRNDEFS